MKWKTAREARLINREYTPDRPHSAQKVSAARRENATHGIPRERSSNEADDAFSAD
jgi:hypothetical protein